jgi:hypothetical protein
MDLYASDRKQRLRDKRRAEGMKAFEVWLDTDGQHRLATLRQAGETVDMVISRALTALERLTVSAASHTQSVPSHAPNPTQSVPSHAREVTPNTLTDDQAQLIALWEQGLEVKAIAAELGITWMAAQSRAHRLQQQGLIQPRPRGGDYPSRRAQARQMPETP